jgi:hypothetical protein
MYFFENIYVEVTIDIAVVKLNFIIYNLKFTINEDILLIN